MNNKRKRSFLDDNDDKIRKILKNSNITMEHSLDADTPESKSHALSKHTENQNHDNVSTITISDDSSSEIESEEKDNNCIRDEVPAAIQTFSANYLGEHTENQHCDNSSTITIGDDSSSESKSEEKDNNCIQDEVVPTAIQIFFANYLSEHTDNQHRDNSSTITIGDDSSSESESVENNNNRIRDEDPTAIQIFFANYLSEHTENQHLDNSATITIGDDCSSESESEEKDNNRIRDEVPAAIPTFPVNYFGEPTNNRNHRTFSASDNSTTESEPTLQLCSKTVPMWFSTMQCSPSDARPYTKDESATVKQLENRNCTSERQDSDDSSSTVTGGDANSLNVAQDS